MVNFFIDRPIFAWVLAIVVMLAGGLAGTTLPIAPYPGIAPPAISIQVAYPGASADTVQSAVTQVIEQQMSGIDHLLYFGSESDADGTMTITLYFEQGTNPDIAQVQVQNKLQLATPLLPVEVQQQGLRVAKATRNFLLVAGFYSSDAPMGGGTGAPCRHQRPRAPHQCGGVRPRAAQGEHRRLAGAAAGRCAHRPRCRELFDPHRVQRQAGGGPGSEARPRRERSRYRERRARYHGQAGAVLSARPQAHLSL